MMKISIISGGKIPRQYYGGTERVIYWLVKELAILGHEVSLSAPEGSYHPYAEEVITYARPEGDINQKIPSDIPDEFFENADLLHVHFACHKDFRKPVLKTVHGYPFHFTGRNEYACPHEFDEATSFVSDAHRRVCGLPNNPYVYNGLDPEEYVFRQGKKSYFLFLGKVDWNVKGLAVAIKIAEKTGMELTIAGDFLDKSFYKTELRPRLSSLIKYVGPVGGQDKAELLADAKALLFPTLWPEPFGLVAIEAMISGTPVLGTTNGALPEIIDHGKTGFMASKPSDTIDQLRRLEEIDPANCRRHVLNKFTSRIMAQNYLNVYLEVIKKWAGCLEK